MKKKKKVDISLIILMIVFIIVLYCYIQLAVQKKKYVDFFGYTFLRVVSGSMMDTIQINDFIIIKLDDKYEIGDIITYRNESNYVTHRIIDMDGKGILTQGDANNTPDAPIVPKDVLGRVVLIIPVAITIKVFTSKEVIAATIISIFGIWFVLHDKHKKKGQVERESTNG